MVYDCQNEVTMKPVFIDFTIIISNFAVTGYHVVTATSRYRAKNTQMGIASH